MTSGPSSAGPGRMIRRACPGPPSCSARRRPASTCSPTTRPAAAHSRRPSASSHGGRMLPSPNRRRSDERRHEPGQTDRPKPAVHRSQPAQRGPSRDPRPRLRDPRRRGGADCHRRPDGLFVLGDAGLCRLGQLVCRGRPAGRVGRPRPGRPDGHDPGRLSPPAADVDPAVRPGRRPPDPRLRAGLQPGGRRLGPLSPDRSDAGRSIRPRSPSWPSSYTSPTGWPSGAPTCRACGAASCRSC